MDFNIITNFKYGQILFNRYDMYVGKSLYYYGEYSEFEIDLFKQIIQPNSGVIDIGTNIGSHTIFFSKAVGEFGEVLGFEPQPIIFQALNANISLNSLSNVRTFQTALGENDDFLYFPKISYNQIANFGGMSMEKKKKTNTNMYLIEQKTLDYYSQFIKKIDFIKIDVEGMELEVLQGAKKVLQNQKPILYVENDRVEKSKDLIEFLWDMDYVLYWHLPPLYNNNNYFKNPNNIFGKILSFNMLCIHKSNQIKTQNMERITSSTHHPKMKPKI